MTKLKGSGSKMSENESKIVCPYCGKALPKDSEFCQFCGKNLASKQDGVVEKLVAEIIINELSESAELIIKKVCLYSIGDERSYIHCYFKSVSERIINAVLFDVMCFDIFGNELPIVHNAQILDISVSRNDTFENTKHIYIDNANVRMVRIKIRKVLLSDGSIIDCDEKQFHFIHLFRWKKSLAQQSWLSSLFVIQHRFLSISPNMWDVFGNAHAEVSILMRKHIAIIANKIKKNYLN